MKVAGFKMLSGEELVARIVITHNAPGSVLGDGLSSPKVTGWTLDRPHVLRVQQVGPNQLGLTFVPWVLANPEISEIYIGEHAVLATFDVSSQVETNYLSQTSGIELGAR